MSFEGYIEILCEAGHKTCIDVYDTDFVLNRDTSNWRCKYCGGRCKWFQIVDQTNGDEHQQHPTLKEPYKFHECKECGQRVTDQYETYVIPEDYGHKV